MIQTLRAPGAASPVTQIPLCVDLDGTLLHTDLLLESLARLLARPWLLAVAVWQLLRGGKAGMKQWAAVVGRVDVTVLPYRDEVIELIEQERARGRRIVLATGADGELARAVSAHLGLFDAVLASDGVVNLTGARKAARLEALYGEAGFDYIGDSRADLPVYAKARRAMMVSGESAGRRFRVFLRAIRVHQWVKNILVAVPLLTSHGWANGEKLLAAAGAFMALSLCASAIYLFNDLLDLESDRRHPTKRRRPLAAGALSIPSALVAMPVLLAGATGIAAWLPPGAGVLLAIYFVTTIAYTTYLKRKLLVDVFTLSLLYTLRMLMGGAATGIECSPWLLAFSIFVFVSLAFCKRAAELGNLRAEQRERAAGRDYFVWDQLELHIFGVAAGYMAAIVLALYIHSPEVRLLYASPEWLWPIVPLFAYWVSRTWILASRGAMNEDPIVFAMRDRVTYLCGVIGGASMMAAATSGMRIPGVGQ